MLHLTHVGQAHLQYATVHSVGTMWSQLQGCASARPCEWALQVTSTSSTHGRKSYALTCTLLAADRVPYDGTMQRAKRKRGDAAGLAVTGSLSVARVPLEGEGSKLAHDAEPEGPAVAAAAGLVGAQQPIPEGSSGTRTAPLLAAPERPEAVLTPEQRTVCVHLLRQAGAEGATVVDRGGLRRLVGPLHVHQQPQTGES